MGDRLFLGYDKVISKNLRLQSGKIVDGVNGINGSNLAMSGCVEVAYVEAAVGMVNGCDPCGTSHLLRSVLEQEGTSESTLKLTQ